MGDRTRFEVFVYFDNAILYVLSPSSCLQTDTCFFLLSPDHWIQAPGLLTGDRLHHP